jgi:sporulation protein YlmC with PRC-barrel domain
MADYKFNGTELHTKAGKLIGKCDGKYVKNDKGSTVGKIDGNKILNAQGSLIAKFDGDKIVDAKGSKIGTMMDVKKSIEGSGGATLAALWVHFVH